MITVAIIDDKPGTRLPLLDYLTRDKLNFKKVLSYNSIDSFLSDPIQHTDLNMVVLDMYLSIGVTALEGLTILPDHKLLKRTKVLMLTSLSDNNYAIFKLLCSCSSSYIDKEMPLYSIKEAILSLHIKGPLVKRSFMPSRTIKYLPRNNQGVHGKLLTFRENQIIQGIIDRKTEFNICRDLAIQHYLFRRYIRSAYKKLAQNPSMNKSVFSLRQNLDHPQPH